MRLVGLLAGLPARASAVPGPPRAQSVLSPDFAATDAGLSPTEARRARDLDVRHRLQRPLLHLHLPAAAGRRDRLVRHPRRRPTAATSSRPGARSPTRTAASRATPTARRARPPRPTASSGARATTRSSPSSAARATATRPATSRTRPSTPRRRTARVDQRQSACDLRFGTSTGALGLRKFPNPRFDAAAWEKIGGWEGYAAFLSDDPASPDSRLNRLWDGSVEPPFRIGMACGACHIAYDPLKPPADPTDPAWENIDALVGNQYSRISNLLGSGLSPHRLEWQLIARARPGIVDTSALPMDFVSNPGTMNAIINFARRPLHENEVLKWRKASACAADADPAACWCEPGREGKCWERSLEDRDGARTSSRAARTSIGYNEAIQRVYFNIGSCAEQCWINHLTDLRAADPEQRNYGQTPFDIGQCRRDCGSLPRHRGPARRHQGLLPDRAARPTSGSARGLACPRDLEVALDAEFGDGAVERGPRRSSPRTAPAAIRASRAPTSNADFTATDPADPTLRLDWLGNDEVAPASEIGTYPARALHSNHMQSRVWAEYASLTEQARPADPLRPEVMKGGGRGYYRNISLLSAWAHAPFMHNNAIGPEILRQARATRRSTSTPRPTSTPTGKPLAEPAGLLALRPERRGPVRALRGLDAGAAEPGPAHPQDVRARPRHRHRHRPRRWRCSAATSGSR